MYFSTGEEFVEVATLADITVLGIIEWKKMREHKVPKVVTPRTPPDFMALADMATNPPTRPPICCAGKYSRR